MILKVGDPDLRKVENEVDDFDSQLFKDDLNLLIDSLEKYKGMGIAAPQIGISRRLLIIDSKPNSRYPHAPTTGRLILVNPHIEKASDEFEYGWEGCLSVPGKRVNVKRSTQISISYKKQDGTPVVTNLTGFAARVFLHEFDHLEGISILDRAESLGDIIPEEEYFKNLPQK